MRIPSGQIAEHRSVLGRAKISQIGSPITLIEGTGPSESGAEHADLLHHCRSDSVRSRAEPHTKVPSKKHQCLSVSGAYARVEKLDGIH